MKYYNCSSLIKEPWFPIKSANTLKGLIKSGRLKATVIQLNKYPKYLIAQEDAIKFLTPNK